MILDAFEVEDINDRTNFVFKKTDKCIELWNTSRGLVPRLETTLEDAEAANIGVPIPYSIDKHFKFLYQKSINFDPDISIHFIGWVNPETFQPIEEEEHE